LGNAELQEFDFLPMGAALSLATILTVIILIILRTGFKIKQSSYTSVLQGGIRQNSYIGLAAAGPLYGVGGEALAAIGILAVIPMVNVISVLALMKIKKTKGLGAIVAFKQLVKNPIIIACALGVFVNASGFGVPLFINETLELVSRGALPLGLLAVGAGLSFGGLVRNPVLLLGSNFLKLILMPVLTAWLCWIFEVDPVASGVAILFAALPSSASSYVMSRQFGGDHGLMAAILTSQVIMAIVTIPLVLLFLT
jgi:predicted permease